MVGVEGPRAWWGVGLARHAGHTEAVLQQRQLFTRNHQEGGGRGRGKTTTKGGGATVKRGGEGEKVRKRRQGTKKVAGGSYT